MSEIDFQRNQELTKWFEESLKVIYSREVVGACVAAIDDEGNVFTGYYHADAQTKAVFAHNINADAMLDVVLNNARMVKEAIDDLEDDDRR